MSRQLAAETADSFRLRHPELVRLLAPDAWLTLRLRLIRSLRSVVLPCCEIENRLRSICSGRHGNLADLLSHYPVAARLVREFTVNWECFVRDFLQHWTHDAPELVPLTQGSGSAERILSFGKETSDPHHGGRTVLILQLKNHRKLVYKPRSVGCESVFSDLLAAINAAGFPWPLRVTQVVDFPDHGWMEYVSTQRCARAQRPGYYFRAGALICLFHALGGVDGHLENLISAGDQPVLIDLETLLHPESSGHDSLFRTGLLPVADDPGYHMAALGKPGGDPLRRYAQEILEGFSATVGFLEHGDFLAAAVAQLLPVTRRKLLRSTVSYLRFHERLLSPRFLSNEVERRRAIEKFTRDSSGNAEERQIEILALDRLDIPSIPLREMVKIPTPGELQSQIPILRARLVA